MFEKRLQVIEYCGKRLQIIEVPADMAEVPGTAAVPDSQVPKIALGNIFNEDRNLQAVQIYLVEDTGFILKF